MKIQFNTCINFFNVIINRIKEKTILTNDTTLNKSKYKYYIQAMLIYQMKYKDL